MNHRALEGPHSFHKRNPEVRRPVSQPTEHCIACFTARQSNQNPNRTADRIKYLPWETIATIALSANSMPSSAEPWLNWGARSVVAILLSGTWRPEWYRLPVIRVLLYSSPWESTPWFTNCPSFQRSSEFVVWRREILRRQVRMPKPTC